MICLSIRHRTAEQIEEILQTVEMAEIRMDLCELTDEQIETLFSSDTPLVATCRFDGGTLHRTGVSVQEAERRLTLAVKAGARYADLEMEAPKPVCKRIAQACAEWGTVLIRSYHNYECTPSIDELKTIVDRCRHYGGELVKIAVKANSEEDAVTVGKLYNYYTAESLVAFAMGMYGRDSRMECLRRGAPFSYACLAADEATAEGQIPYGEMWDAVYGRDCVPFKVSGVRVPASKSYAQRAIIAAALADGVSVLNGYTDCGDSLSAIAVAEQAGASVVRKSRPDGTCSLEIRGIGADGTAAAKSQTLCVGESGLLTRLMLPLSCALFRDGALIEGTGTLLSRPLQGACDFIAALGGSLDGETVPLRVEGPLCPGRIVVDGSKSSQLVSGALMSLPLCARNSTLYVENPTSIPYIYMTMDVLRKFGIKVRSEMYGGRRLLAKDWDSCTEIVLKIRENQRYKAAVADLEGDWSAAAVFLAAGAVFGDVEVEGLDTTSLQADLCMMDILMDAGASLSQMDEPRGAVRASKSPLQAVVADLSNSPDLFPVVAVFCAFCQGRSRLGGVHRLLHKESDRADAIVEMLSKLGVRVQVKDDSMFISGESLAARLLNGHMLRGGEFTSRHDHRMVMALRLASLGADSPVVIDDTECVSKSFPDFNVAFGRIFTSFSKSKV